MFLRLVLFFQLLHVVNDIHFKWNTGIPGVAPVNIIFVIAVILIRNQPDPVTAKPMLLKPILYWFGAMTLAFVWGQLRASGNFMDDLTYWKNALFFPLFYFLFFRCAQDLKTTRWLILWILVIAAVAGLEALREGFDYGFGKYNAMRRASGPFGDDWHNANRAGVFYGMFMPMFVALVLFLKGKANIVRLGAIGACVLIAGGAVATYSRQAYFLVLLAIALLLLRRSIAAAVAVGVLLVSLATYLPDSVFQRVEETKQTGKSGEEEVDESTASRWEIWAGGGRMLLSNPIGVGLHKWKGEIGNYCSHKGMDAHNFYVLTVGEGGPVGLAALLYVVWSLFGLATWARTNRPPDDPEMTAFTVGFTICTLNMALGAIYGSPTLEGAVMAPYWALAGLLERYIHLHKMGAGAVVITQVHDDSLESRFPLASFIAPGRRKK